MSREDFEVLLGSVAARVEAGTLSVAAAVEVVFEAAEAAEGPMSLHSLFTARDALAAASAEVAKRIAAITGPQAKEHERS